jgi:tetratricopeptide (TPR) repeat protein
LRTPLASKGRTFANCFDIPPDQFPVILKFPAIIFDLTRNDPLKYRNLKMKSLARTIIFAASILLFTSHGTATSTDQVKKLTEEHGYQEVVNWIVNEQGGATIQVDNQFRFMLGKPDLKYINANTILADLKRIGVSPEKLRVLLPKKYDKIEQKETPPPTSDPIESMDAEGWYQKGLRAMLAGDSQNALEAFSEAIRLNPKQADAYKQRGVIVTV